MTIASILSLNDNAQLPHSMKRYSNIDLARGLIMVFMALDHASLMVGRRHFQEMWGVDFERYPDVFWWLTRFVSHFCAPGFFFLMGMSMLLLAEKRLASNWSAARIRNYFLKRGGLILLVMLFLEVPAFVLGDAFAQSLPSHVKPGQYNGGFIWPGTVLYGLGTCMILGAFLWRLGNRALLGISVGCFALSGWYLHQTDPFQHFHPLLHAVLVPGKSDGALIMYPIIPWLGIACFGIFWGRLLKTHPQKIYDWSLKTGLAFIGAALLVRALGHGNFQVSDYSDWVSFFTLVKYPPSLTFALLTCGVHLLLLYVFVRSFGRPWLQPLLVFGQTAMFFYIAHLYLYALIGIAFPEGCAIGWMYLIWLLGLLILYFLCQRYLAFKRAKPPNSIWRML